MTYLGKIKVIEIKTIEFETLKGPTLVKPWSLQNKHLHEYYNEY